MAYDEAREKEMKKRGIKVLSEKVLPKMSSKVNAVSSKVEQATNARFEETLDDSENNDLVCEGPGLRFVWDQFEIHAGANWISTQGPS